MPNLWIEEWWCSTYIVVKAEEDNPGPVDEKEDQLIYYDDPEGVETKYFYYGKNDGNNRISVVM